MILGFKKQFVSKILSGEKIHTIREDKHNRWETGKKIHFATGMRTKNYNCFKIGICKSVQKIEITYKGNKIFVEIEGNPPYIWIQYLKEKYTHPNILKLAKNDGFDNIDDFFKWFDKDFTGKLIHFTNKKY